MKLILLFVIQISYAGPGAVCSENNISLSNQRSLGAVSAYLHRVDLKKELSKKWKSGGRIFIKAENGKTFALREEIEPKNQVEELARRNEAYEIFAKLHFSKKDEVYPGSLEITSEQKELFRKFSLTDIGAIWLRKIIDDDIAAFNEGYLEFSKPQFDNKTESFLKAISGKLSDEGSFSGYHVFKVFGYDGVGAQGQSGLVGLGNKGFKENFITGEKVDPIAILSHEFGHTKWGDPASGETLEGEAETVLNYENPMRQQNGHDDRKIYYSPKDDKSIEVKTKKIHQGVLKILN